MKKVVLLVSLIYVVLALFVSYLTLLLPWSVTSKAICLIWCWFVSLSVVSLVIRESQVSWSIIKTLDGSNHLATLAKKEQEILSTKGKKTGTLTSDFYEQHGPWCDGYCCMYNPRNLYYRRDRENGSISTDRILDDF